jgi:hypothetical protein
MNEAPRGIDDTDFDRDALADALSHDTKLLELRQATFETPDGGRFGTEVDGHIDAVDAKSPLVVARDARCAWSWSRSR